MPKQPGVPYTQDPRRQYPGCIIFLVDQSGSMNEPIAGGQGKTKADAVAEAINALLGEAITKSTRQGVVRDYFHVGAIGYGTNEDDALDYARPAFSGERFNGRELIPISEIAESPAGFVTVREKIHNDDTDQDEEVENENPVWLEPRAYGRTPMCQAFELAHNILEKWVDDPKYRDCFPPMVFNITDGAQTDGKSEDVIAAAKKLMRLSTSDGNALVYNCHISDKEGNPVVFPSDTAGIADEYAVTLFEASSIIPDAVRNLMGNVQQLSGARGFVFNANINMLISALNTGTPVNMVADKPGH